MGNSEILQLTIYEFKGNGQLKSLDIKYTDKNEKLLSSENILNKKTTSSIAVIKKEMTKKEINKFQKGKLF